MKSRQENHMHGRFLDRKIQKKKAFEKKVLIRLTRKPQQEMVVSSSTSKTCIKQASQEQPTTLLHKSIEQQQETKSAIGMHGLSF